MRLQRRVGSGDGEFSLSVSKSEDDTYEFSLIQTDQAGNVSDPVAFHWTRDTTIPATPTVVSPDSSPFYSNTASIVISGGCQDGAEVRLAGATSDLTLCSGGAYSFTVAAASDGEYQYSLSQVNGAGSSSASANVEWRRDTVPPAAPTITDPASSPHLSGAGLRIAGACETDATVALETNGGTPIAETSCASSAYSFDHDEAADGTYGFRVRQTDRAGNASDPALLTWTRDTSVPSAPVLLTPSQSPYLSSSSPLSVSGTCDDGLTVVLEGDASNTRECSGGTFSFSVSEGVDGSYQLSLRQYNGVTYSDAVPLTWTLDTVRPTVQIDSAPSDPQVGTSAAFEFSSDDGEAVFECDLNGSGFGGCTSPHSYADLDAGAYVFSVRARDPAGNVSVAATHSWNQEAPIVEDPEDPEEPEAPAATVALYHFDGAEALLDSGEFSNDLMTSGTSSVAGRFGQARSLTASGGHYLSAPDSAALGSVGSTMTVEAYVRFSSLPTSNGQKVVIASQSADPGNCASNCGWYFGITRQGGPNSRRIFFGASIDAGATMTTVMSGQENLNTNTWYHIAVTWNQGTVTIHLDGAAVYTGPIGVEGAEAIHDTTADLLIGASAAGQYLDGSVDEFRISNIVRDGFPPSEAYVAD